MDGTPCSDYINASYIDVSLPFSCPPAQHDVHIWTIWGLSVNHDFSLEGQELNYHNFRGPFGHSTDGVDATRPFELASVWVFVFKKPRSTWDICYEFFMLLIKQVRRDQ